jgi:hypothetical protein
MLPPTVLDVKARFAAGGSTDRSLLAFSWRASI